MRLIPVCCLLIFTLFISCKDEEAISVISFEKTSDVFDEDAGKIKIGIKINPPRNERTRLELEWTSTDPNTQWGGDFEMSILNLTIGSFDEIGYFDLTIIDDAQIDADDIIQFVIKAPELPGAQLSDNDAQTKYRILISNNDKHSPGTLQADLSWKRPNPYDQITVMNLDLYVHTGVVTSGSGIVNIGNIYKAANNTGQFETIKLGPGDPNIPYFLVVFFQQALLAEFVTYTLNVYGLGSSIKTYSKSIDGPDVGAAIAYGPFYKQSNGTFTGGRSTNEEVRAYYLDHYDPTP